MKEIKKLRKVEIIKTVDGWEIFYEGNKLLDSYETQEKAYYIATDHFFYRGYKLRQTENEYDFSHFFVEVTR